MFGHLWVDVLDDPELAVGEDVDDFAEGLAVAAWATAAPPPTSTPESVIATSALRIPCRIVVHLLPLVTGCTQPAPPGNLVGETWEGIGNPRCGRAMAEVVNPPGPLVSPDWLRANLGRPGLVLADCRWVPGGSAADIFAAGHIPGAVLFDAD